MCPSGARPGNALVEFVLCLPIIFFLTGLTVYMSFAMLARQQALVKVRHDLFTVANRDWPRMVGVNWSTPTPTVDLTGSGGDRPRGKGEELERLRPEVEPVTIARVTNNMARDFWQRVWSNLPGRHSIHATQTWESKGTMWNFLDHTAMADLHRDSSSWHWRHLDVWKIGRSGPWRDIFQAFYDNLQTDVAPHFKPTRDDLMQRWWHGSDILADEAAANQAGE